MAQQATSVQFITPVGRLVQGGFEAQTKDSKGQPLVVKTGTNKGQPTQRYFIAVAFAKNDPAWGPLWEQIYAVGRAGYPQMFDATGRCTHPRFAFKVMDGDGVDHDGKPNNAKPGFAGHWVVKFSSSFAPKCYYAGKYDPSQQIQNPDDVIKKGYYVRVSGNMSPNIGSDVPGVYVNCDMVELVAQCPPDQIIVSGPSAADTFGKAPAVQLPAGAIPLDQIPHSGAAAAAGMPMPGQPTMPAMGAPQQTVPAPGMPMPGQATMPAMGAPPAMQTPTPATLPPANPGFVQNAGMPSMPMPGNGAAMPMPGVSSVAASPVYQMTPAAQGYTREQYHANGVTDQQLLDSGYMTRVA